MTTQTQSNIEHNTELLIQASRKGDIDEIKRLIPISDPKSEQWGALQVVASEGYIDCVKLLIPVSDPKQNNSAALLYASEHGYTEIVQLLIPVSDPKANGSWALQAAVKENQINAIKLLIPVSDYTLVMQTLLNNKNVYNRYDTTVFQQCIDEYEALQQKNHLQDTIDEVVENKLHLVKRKM